MKKRIFKNVVNIFFACNFMVDFDSCYYRYVFELFTSIKNYLVYKYGLLNQLFYDRQDEELIISPIPLRKGLNFV